MDVVGGVGRLLAPPVCGPTARSIPVLFASARGEFYASRMRRVWLVGGVLLVIGGSIWVLQGLNVAFAPKSVMTGDPLWIVLGIVAVLGGAALVGANRRARGT
jgi:hypothetical protein